MLVSVILEWENMAYAEQARPRQAMAALTAQAAALFLPEASPPLEGNPALRLSAPLEIIISYNSDRVDAAVFHKNVSDLMTEGESFRIRHIPVSNGTYGRQKNAGAAAAIGDLIIFLDSDVIPEPGWLAAFMEAFVDPGVCAAVGNTYVDTRRGSAYSRSMALTWMFPLRDSEGRLTPSEWFYANNVAFRRETFSSHSFPHTPGLKHHAAVLLTRELQQNGITLWHVGGARAHHPAPRGIVHFISRAVAAGRARVLGSESVELATLMRWVWGDAAEVGWFCRRIAREGSRVDMQWWQIPTSMSVTVAYYWLRFCGSLMTYLVPGLMRRRFDL